VATLYEPSGRDRVYRPLRRKKFTLDELQSLIGGYVEMVGIRGDAGSRVFFVDEEGRLKRLRPNVRGSRASRSSETLSAVHSRRWTPWT
jgi:hypothetical protein